MAFTIKNVNKIRQVVRLKQVMQRWKSMGLTRRPVLYSDDSDDSEHRRQQRKRIPSGSLGVYVGIERRRFVIPMRYLNLPLFASLLEKAEEEYGFENNGGLVLPCEVDFFKQVLKLLGRDERRFGGIGLDEFVKLFSQVGFDSCKDPKNEFTRILQKTRV